jgi:UDP-N-acetylmuramate dehydrogenase
MSASGLCSDLKKLIKGSVVCQEPMFLHTSWRIGGPAEIFAEPRGIGDLAVLMEYADCRGILLTVIGAGTNILVRDGGISGIVVKISDGLSGVGISGQVITAGAGFRFSRLASAAREAGIGGFEFAAGIPGTVGGAVIMNAGSNGASTSDLVCGVTCIDFKGRPFRLENRQIDWGYRTSGLQGRDIIVVEAVFKGYPREKDLIAADIENFLHRRKASQPLEYPNSGSVFKNPPGHFAGRLIQEAGCQGMRVGDAQVSTKHANFIINLGKARASDVMDLITRVREMVLDKFGIGLEMEVKVLGCD